MHQLFLGFGLIVVLLSSPAKAQVLEIQVDGTVTRHEGPAVYTVEGVTRIEPTANPSSSIEGSTPSTPSDNLLAEVEQAALGQRMSPNLLKAVAWRESRFQPDAMSPKGAFGVMQLTEAAAREVGVDRFDVSQNILGGAAYLRRMIDTFGGDLALGLAAYNAGPGAVRRHGGVPPYRETEAYVAAVLDHFAQASGASSQSRTIP